MIIKDENRFLGWLIALILAMIFMIYQMMSCVSIRIMTEDDDEKTGVSTEIQKLDSIN